MPGGEISSTPPAATLPSEAGGKVPYLPVHDWSDIPAAANVAGSFWQKFKEYFWYSEIKGYLNCWNLVGLGDNFLLHE